MSIKSRFLYENKFFNYCRVGYNKYYLTYGSKLDYFDVAVIHKYSLKLFIGRFNSFINVYSLNLRILVKLKFFCKTLLKAILKLPSSKTSLL